MLMQRDTEMFKYKLIIHKLENYLKQKLGMF